MTTGELARIRRNVASNADTAEAIMDGGDNYDGADGARAMMSVCADARRLIAALGPHVKGDAE